MDKSDLVYDIQAGMSGRAIADKRNCSLSTIRYWMKKYELHTLPVHHRNPSNHHYEEVDDLTCQKHGLIAHPKIYNGRKRCPQCLIQWQKDRRKRTKQELLDYKGGAVCSSCKETYKAELLHFHHLEDKEFTLAASLHNKSWTKLCKEVDKCIVLCSRCHAEKHEIEISQAKTASAEMQRFYRRRKEKLVGCHGGSCRLCSYNKSCAGLQFHHIDPKAKAFGLAGSAMYKNWETVYNESLKCILVCANCHAEIEMGIRNEKDLEKFNDRLAAE